MRSGRLRFVATDHPAGGTLSTLFALKDTGMSEEKSLILIVDDDAGIRAVLRLLMEREGYRVTEASTGVEAVAAFERCQPV